MCIRDRLKTVPPMRDYYSAFQYLLSGVNHMVDQTECQYHLCLLYTSDAADDLHCVDFGGRRITKKKKKN